MKMVQRRAVGAPPAAGATEGLPRPVLPRMKTQAPSPDTVSPELPISRA